MSEIRNKAKQVLERAKAIRESKVVETPTVVAEAKDELFEAASKPLTNNPGNGFHGQAMLKHKNDNAKAHAEYRKMHAKVKDMAGEAGHLTNSKKPNIMVRDYLDSKRGRHVADYQNDDKYIKKDFGQFAKTYDPKLFTERVLDEERMDQHGGFKVGDVVSHEGYGPMHIHSINLFKGSKEPQALLGHKPAGKGRGIRHAFISSLKPHKVDESLNDPDTGATGPRDVLNRLLESKSGNS